jgi:putative oxidoreductase
VPTGLRGARGPRKDAREQGGEGQLMSAPRAMDAILADAGLLAGRCLLVFIFLHEGFGILGNYAPAAAFMQKSGVPSLLLPAVIALQLVGGLLIAAGAITRLSALAFAAFCVLTAILFHWQFADRNQLLHFQKDLAITGGFLILACCGPGGWSLGRYLPRMRGLFS